MANVLIFNIFLILTVSRVQSCFIPGSLNVVVPRTIQPGYTIRTGVLDCDFQTIQFNLLDPHFEIKSDGTVVAVSPVSVETGGRTFSVWVQDNSGPGSVMEVHLIPEHTDNQGFLKRSKRRWSPPPFNILENDPGPFPKAMENISSDAAAKYKVFYTMTGPGFDQHPLRVFTLEPETGMLSMHKPVDREEFPIFRLTVRVFDKTTRLEKDLPLPIEIIVDDVNDNHPQFTDLLQFSVLEKSSVGSIVGKVNATDRDKPGSDHVKIRYKLLTGTDLFAINPETGVITTATNTLDREVKDTHTVTVEIKDMNGADNGLATRGTATITLGDINDNPPTFKQPSYAANVLENEVEKLILRIPVDDKDLINTPNWISKFVITKGNENGNFRIETDPKTNEGLLYVAKPLDYEKNKSVKIEVSARNVAELTGTDAQWLSIPVDVAVGDVDEGPEFSAPTLRIPVKENTPNGTVIGRYTAVDPETKSSEGIRYYKLSDPGSWINVDRNTGQLKVANTIDRESPLVQDGLYNISVKAVDASSKSAEGTVILQVEDVNDNVPELPKKLVMCEKEGEHGSVLVVAEDKDQGHFSAPFSFSLAEDMDGKWSVVKFNDTAATLQQKKDLPTGIYEVPMLVTDLQGSGRQQSVEVRICQCRTGVCLAQDRSMSLGPLALLAMLLPLALLLLLCLLLAFFCVTKREKMKFEDTGDSGGILLKSNTEAPGDEVDSSLINIPLGVEPGVKGSALNVAWPGNKSSSTMGAQSIREENGMYKAGISTTNMHEYLSSQYDGHYDSQYDAQYGSQFVGTGMNFDNRQLIQDSAFLHTWQTNGRYLHQKLGYMGNEADGRYADDIIHAYGYEGEGSAAGSVGCCSDFGDNDNLDFVNTLGPKFKTLADVCTKT